MLFCVVFNKKNSRRCSMQTAHNCMIKYKTMHGESIRPVADSLHNSKGFLSANWEIRFVMVNTTTIHIKV